MYKHQHSCGSGYVRSSLKISSLKIGERNKVEIKLDYGWMGDEKVRYTLSCTLLPISGPYNIIRVDSFNDGEKEYIKTAYFDAYIFEEVLDTEWNKGIPIGLYMGNGPSSTEKFSLQIHINDRIVSDDLKHTEMEKVLKILNGLKYEKMG